MSNPVPGNGRPAAITTPAGPGGAKDVGEAFAVRHIGPDAAEVERMLEVVGAPSLEALIDEAMPAAIRADRPLALPEPLSEREAVDQLRRIVGRNEVLVPMIGQGYHGTITPPVLTRNVLENPAWYTAYTPYQPEISQGRLEALLNFQTMVADLTGLDIANASLLDEGSAAAEAMAMARRISKVPGSRFLVDRGCHPQTISVVANRAEAVGIEVVVTDTASSDMDGVFGVLVQYPATDGHIGDHAATAERARAAGALTVAATDLLASTLLVPPGEWGADIAVGSSQRFGVPLMFGGPHAAFIATREEHVRTLPGRLVGVSVDSGGRTAYRLALQTREQHIRRERATSNVCTAQVLLAVIAGFYAVYHGAEGLTRIAEQVHRSAGRLAAAITDAGLRLRSDRFFDTVVVDVGSADRVMAAGVQLGVDLRRFDDSGVAVAVDETTTDEHLHLALRALGIGSLPDAGPRAIPDHLRRTSPFLTHPVFASHRTEHEMLRYLRKLADKDLALDRTMIPLGSCTMKLNATSEMIPIGWTELADLHPYVPLEQAEGYVEMIRQLEEWLCEITGYDAVSLQPNAGSQGELAGLLAIRAHHRSRGQGARTVCLIPSSAHGTNAASAVMAGMRVVVVACDEDGNVDLADLQRLADEHSDRLAAIMVTYPSTHGVFEEGIVEVCRIVHEHGGQVYVDGANLNALVGLSRLADLGADVSHLNLHKTFTIPHGGGGPGVGPVGVRAHLAEFLPGDPLGPDPGRRHGATGPIASARWGSAGILAISWMYIAMMGAAGLTEASRVAILSANYIASRLGEAYPVLYTGSTGRVAHECIVDIRPLSRASGVGAEDVARRLTDYGFHAPTVSFPVAGTLMIEPTESESLEEIERFCEAMLAIRAEIDRVADGEWPRDDNPIVNAPHPVDALLDGWTHPYTRAEAVRPVPSLAGKLYHPPVGRIDSASGDRHLMCSCPPVDAFMD